MTWLDFVIIIAFAGLLSLAYKRGIVLEVTEFLALIAGGFMGFRLYRPISEFAHTVLVKGWSVVFLERASFFTIFIVVFLAVFSAGLTIERRMKEEKKLDKMTDQRMGLAFGFFKSLWLISLILGLFFYMEMVPIRKAPPLRRGAFVSLMLGLRTFVAPTVYIMAPADLAKKFMKEGLGSSTARKEKA